MMKVIREIARIAGLLIIALPLFALYLLLQVRGSKVLPRRWDDDE